MTSSWRALGAAAALAAAAAGCAVTPADVSRPAGLVSTTITTTTPSTTTTTTAPPAGAVSLTSGSYQGADHFVVTTPRGVWWFKKAGGGFARLLDPAGRDWIGYRPGGGGAGEFRGIPNMVNPEGCFHPGLTNAASTASATPTRVTITTSATCRGSWRMTWEITADKATATVTQTGEGPFWFLYEGTPGGALDSDDFVMRSTGQTTSSTESWGRGGGVDLRWAAFADPAAGQALVMIDADGPDGQPDSYDDLVGQMTVFGFGRSELPNPAFPPAENSHLTGSKTFVVGLIPTAAPTEIPAAVAALQ
ncbi:MAG: hypothetical protein ACKVWR_00055 [Acidimicrobiales bacterium]